MATSLGVNPTAAHDVVSHTSMSPSITPNSGKRPRLIERAAIQDTEKIRQHVRSGENVSSRRKNTLSRVVDASETNEQGAVNAKYQKKTETFERSKDRASREPHQMAPKRSKTQDYLVVGDPSELVSRYTAVADSAVLQGGHDGHRVAVLVTKQGATRDAASSECSGEVREWKQGQRASTPGPRPSYTPDPGPSPDQVDNVCSALAPASASAPAALLKEVAPAHAFDKSSRGTPATVSDVLGQHEALAMGPPFSVDGPDVGSSHPSNDPGVNSENVATEVSNRTGTTESSEAAHTQAPGLHHSPTSLNNVVRPVGVAGTDGHTLAGTAEHDYEPQTQEDPSQDPLPAQDQDHTADREGQRDRDEDEQMDDDEDELEDSAEFPDGTGKKSGSGEGSSDEEDQDDDDDADADSDIESAATPADSNAETEAMDQESIMGSDINANSGTNDPNLPSTSDTALVEARIKAVVAEQAKLAAQYATAASEFSLALSARLSLTLNEMDRCAVSGKDSHFLMELYHNHMGAQIRYRPEVLEKLREYQETDISSNASKNNAIIWGDFYKRKAALRDEMQDDIDRKMMDLTHEATKQDLGRYPVMDWISGNLDVVRDLGAVPTITALSQSEIVKDLDALKATHVHLDKKQIELEEFDSMTLEELSAGDQKPAVAPLLDLAQAAQVPGQRQLPLQLDPSAQAVQIAVLPNGEQVLATPQFAPIHSMMPQVQGSAQQGYPMPVQLPQHAQQYVQVVQNGQNQSPAGYSYYGNAPPGFSGDVPIDAHQEPLADSGHDSKGPVVDEKPKGPEAPKDAGLHLAVPPTTAALSGSASIKGKPRARSRSSSKTRGKTNASASPRVSAKQFAPLPQGTNQSPAGVQLQPQGPRTDGGAPASPAAGQLLMPGHQTSGQVPQQTQAQPQGQETPIYQTAYGHPNASGQVSSGIIQMTPGTAQAQLAYAGQPIYLEQFGQPMQMVQMANYTMPPMYDVNGGMVQPVWYQDANGAQMHQMAQGIPGAMPQNMMPVYGQYYYPGQMVTPQETAVYYDRAYEENKMGNGRPVQTNQWGGVK